MSRIKEYFQKLVKDGVIPQEPANYDAATLKIYIDHLESENAELRAKVEKAVEDVAERIKEAFYYEFDEIIPSIMSDKIDEIVREAVDDD